VTQNGTATAHWSTSTCAIGTTQLGCQYALALLRRQLRPLSGIDGKLRLLVKHAGIAVVVVGFPP
jgi:hypothetical protein